jgi:hypothetical protein
MSVAPALSGLAWPLVALYCTRLLCKTLLLLGDKAVEASEGATKVAGDKVVEAAGKLAAPLSKMADTLEKCTCVLCDMCTACCAPSRAQPRADLPAVILKQCARACGVSQEHGRAWHGWRAATLGGRAFHGWLPASQGAQRRRDARRAARRALKAAVPAAAPAGISTQSERALPRCSVAGRPHG